MQYSSALGKMVPATGSLPTGDSAFVLPDEQEENEDFVEAPSVARPAKTQGVAKKVKTLAPRDVVKLAKARLRDIKKELRRLKALEKERAQLERLIDAADGKPRAVVHNIKRTAG
jgi:hypothetical protein